MALNCHGLAMGWLNSSATPPAAFQDDTHCEKDVSWWRQNNRQLSKNLSIFCLSFCRNQWRRWKLIYFFFLEWCHSSQSSENQTKYVSGQGENRTHSIRISPPMFKLTLQLPRLHVNQHIQLCCRLLHKTLNSAELVYSKRGVLDSWHRTWTWDTHTHTHTHAHTLNLFQCSHVKVQAWSNDLWPTTILTEWLI